MKTYLAEIIPKIEKFSERLENLAKLTDKHWISLEDITNNKKVYIFRNNKQLLIAENGIVKKGLWDYLGKQSFLIEVEDETYLFKQGFLDESILALKLDSTNTYAFFVNEDKLPGKLNTIIDVLQFLNDKYMDINGNMSDSDTCFPSYNIVNQKDKYDLAWGSFTEYNIEFFGGLTGQLYKGHSSGKYFYMNSIYGKKYDKDMDIVAQSLYLYLKNKNTQ